MAFYPPRNGGGGGGPVTGLTGTPTEIVYIDNTGNGTGDSLATRDSVTNDTIIQQVSGDFTQGMDLGTITIGPLLGGINGNVLSRESSTGLLGKASIGVFNGTDFGYDTVGAGSFVTDSTGQVVLTFSDPTNGIRFSYFNADLTVGSDGGLTPIGVQFGASDNATYWNKMWLPKDSAGFIGSELPGNPTIYTRVEVSPTTVELRGNTNSTRILLDDNTQEIKSRSNLFGIYNNIDRAFLTANTQNQVLTVGDTTNSYTGSLLTFDSNNSIYTFLAKANSGGTISNTVLSGTGNSIVWDSDTTDDIEAEIAQGDNLLGAGIKGNLLAYSDSNTGETINFILGDATSIGGGAFTAAIQYVLGDIGNSLIIDATGSSFQYDNAATTTNSSVQTTATYASSRWSDGTVASLMRLNATDALLEYDNGTTATSVKVEDGVVTVNNPIKMQGYTVATLPTGAVGQIAYVTDALAPSFLAAVVGGGAIVTPVFHNGTTWVAY